MKVKARDFDKKFDEGANISNLLYLQAEKGVYKNVTKIFPGLLS